MPDTGRPRDSRSVHPPEALIPADAGQPAGTGYGAVGGGAARPILLYPDPRLNERCAPAAGLKYPELRALVADLFATLYAAGGRGLAAPQIGVAHRVFVMDDGWKTGAPRPLAVIEPQIISRSRRMQRAEELCLSIPGRPVMVRRPAEIRLAFFDLDGRACDLALDGAAARIAQHEADHLDGVLILTETAGRAAAQSGAVRPKRRGKTRADRAAVAPVGLAGGTESGAPGAAAP